MKNRVTFATSLSILGCLLAFLVLLVSCSSAPTAPATQAPGAAPTTAQAGPTTAPAASPPAAASPAAAAQKPQYGGTLTTVLGNDPTNFDSGTKGQGGSPGSAFYYTYQQYMVQDWTKGPAGGAPRDYYIGGAPFVQDLYYPQLADSWKMPSVGVWVLQIRQGVHWQNIDTPAGQLMHGREMTADDIVASLKRLLAAPKSWMNVGQPAAAKAITVEKTGPWEVTIKTPVAYLTSFFWIIQGGGFNVVYPPEVVAKYGDVADWHNTVGTGPYILKDYTKGSQLTFVKNPNYWETNPIGPGKGDKLPYIDTFKELIIPDASTQLAAFRTGKVDTLPAVTKEDAQPILKANPEVVNIQYLTNGFSPNATYAIAMNTHVKPYSDKRVRQAMMLATDFKAMSQTLFGGDAQIDVWPVNSALAALFQPLSEMPQSVQDLYNYNPDKAKQLLSQAGYPNGFTADVVTSNVPQLTDELSLYKSMWAKAGITLNIKPMENAAFVSLTQGRRYTTELVYRGLVTFMPVVLYYSPYRGASTNNPSFIDDPAGTDPVIEQSFKDANANVFVNWPAAYAAYKKIKPDLLENAYVIPRPTPYVYNMWWPWLKDFYGGLGDFAKFAWIDQKLKASMGH